MIRPVSDVLHPPDVTIRNDIRAYIHRSFRGIIRLGIYGAAIWTTIRKREREEEGTVDEKKFSRASILVA